MGVQICADCEARPVIDLAGYCQVCDLNNTMRLYVRLYDALSLIRDGEINGHILARRDMQRIAGEALDTDNR